MIYYQRLIVLLAFLMSIEGQAQLYAPEIKVQQTSGGVGIGTSNPHPDAKLHVNGSITLPRAGSTSGNNHGIAYWPNQEMLWDGEYLVNYGFGFHTYDQYEPWNYQGQVTPYISGYWGIDLFTARTNRFRITHRGNVGIGVTNPSQKLHVNGNALAWNVSVTSDMKLKQDIRDYAQGLALVKEIHPKKYRYKPRKVKKVKASLADGETIDEEVFDQNDQEYIGVVAQELQEIAPDLVGSFTDDEGEETLTVNHTALTFILINAVKEQQLQIEAMQKQLDTLVPKKQN